MKLPLCEARVDICCFDYLLFLSPITMARVYHEESNSSFSPPGCGKAPHLTVVVETCPGLAYHSECRPSYISGVCVLGGRGYQVGPIRINTRDFLLWFCGLRHPLVSMRI